MQTTIFFLYIIINKYLKYLYTFQSYLNHFVTNFIFFALTIVCTLHCFDQINNKKLIKIVVKH